MFKLHLAAIHLELQSANHSCSTWAALTTDMLCRKVRREYPRARILSRADNDVHGHNPRLAVLHVLHAPLSWHGSATSIA
jgi:hypothetical protein